jgi:hypothetical protein
LEAPIISQKFNYTLAKRLERDFSMQKNILKIRNMKNKKVKI